MLYDPTRTGIEGIKALLSVAVLYVGSVVAGGAAPDVAPASRVGAAEDVLGLWAWVVESSPCRPDARDALETQYVELRRNSSGRLEARALLRSNGESQIRALPGASFEDGRLRLELGHGAAFHGTLQPDGRSIDGVVESDGEPAVSILRRLNLGPRRTLREPPPLRAA